MEWRTVRKAITGTLTAVLLLGGPLTAYPQTSGGAKGGAPARATHRIIVNGRPVDGDVAPVFVGDKIMVPIRFITEYMGGEADWQPAERRVVLKTGKKEEIRMVIGSTQAYYQGEGRALSQAPVLLDGRTLLPLREVSRLFGVQVNYNENSRVVFITVPQGSLEPGMRKMTPAPVDTRTRPSSATPNAGTTGQ
jgi:hypothetical protein